MCCTVHRIQFNSGPPQKRKHTAKVGSSFMLVEWGLKIVCKDHIYAFLLKTEVLLAQFV